MLLYVVVILLILSGAVVYYYYQTPAYKVTDRLLGYPDFMGFDRQNCQLDGSCWVKYIDSPEYEPRNSLRPPFKGWNSVHLDSEYKTVDMPTNFFSPEFGRRSLGYYPSPNYPI